MTIGQARQQRAGNRMRVAECEVAFAFRRAIDPRHEPWTREQVLVEVGSASKPASS